MSVIRFLAGSRRFAFKFALLVCALVCVSYSLRAESTDDGPAIPDGKSTAGKATAEEETPDYKNWIELGIGGNTIAGDAAQFKQEHRMSGDVFGGIEDMHWEHSIGQNGTFSIDGRAIFDNHDYNVNLELNLPGLGYIRGGYTEFRTWYDGNGGFSPADGGAFIPPPFPELTLDRGIAWVELGLRIPDWPEITINYSHEFRNGDKDSTIWGDATVPGVGSSRKIAPAFRNIDETQDLFSFDASKTFGNTDIDLGMRYEHDDNDDRLQLQRGVGNPSAQRFITQHDQSDLNLFSGHVISETRLSDTLLFTAGYSYTTLGSDISGTRVIGTDYNSMFVSPLPVSQRNDQGFLNLAGTSEVDDHIVNANFFWMPVKDLSVLAGFRYTHENQDSDAVFIETTVPSVGAPAILDPTSADTSQDFDNFAERFEARYTGISNWLFWAEGEWTEENGTVRQHSAVDGELTAMLNKDTSLFGQKYAIGANWYAMSNLSFSGEYYYQAADYDNDFKADLAGGQRLQSEDWNTNDFNIRINFRPKIPAYLGTLSMVTRYDYMQTLVSGVWSIDELRLAEENTALITSHVIGETLTWSPRNRLYLQATLSYVLDETKTPASNIIISDTAPTVLNFQSDYWTVTGSVGFIIDDKTDFHADYTFYRADDYVNNIAASLPYGAGATEHTVSASISRQMTKQIRLVLRYAYFDYSDDLSGGHNNYRAHSVYSGLQFRF